MTTTKKRLNISLSRDLDSILSHIAKRDNMPEATKATLLLAIALEIEEDIVFDKIASERDTKDNRFVNHKKAWS